MKKLIFILVFLFASIHGQTNNEKIRPIQDNIGFCWNADEMNNLMDYLSRYNKNANQSSKNLVAAISVHDDYLYAGNVYYPLYKNIKAKEVIIFGLMHGMVRKEIGPKSNILILDEFDKWKGPYKDVEISPLREIIKSKLSKEYFIVNNKAQSIEHSIEAEIPFLQYYNRNVKITPIMVTNMPLEKMDEISSKLSEIIIDYCKSNNLKLGRDIFFLISNDANHYGEDFNNSPYGMDKKAHETATNNDKRIIKEDLEGKIDEVKISSLAKELISDSTKKNVVPLWCGRNPILFGLKTISKIVDGIEHKNIYGKLFKYSDTFTEKVLPVKNTSMGVTAVFNYKHWCGWFTEGFYLEK